MLRVLVEALDIMDWTRSHALFCNTLLYPSVYDLISLN